jgi:hypothetical protein
METTQTMYAESAILARVISPQKGGLSPQAAKALLDLSFAQSDIDRMNELAEKNRHGEVSVEELEELERYSRIGSFLNLMQSKARQSLAHG